MKYKCLQPSYSVEFNITTAKIGVINNKRKKISWMNIRSLSFLKKLLTKSNKPMIKKKCKRLALL